MKIQIKGVLGVFFQSKPGSPPPGLEPDGLRGGGPAGGLRGDVFLPVFAVFYSCSLSFFYNLFFRFKCINIPEGSEFLVKIQTVSDDEPIGYNESDVFRFLFKLTHFFFIEKCDDPK